MEEDLDTILQLTPAEKVQLEKVSLEEICNLILSFSELYFKKVKISATALIKMVMHTKLGGDIEVMGNL
jgi:hypothetical protein